MTMRLSTGLRNFLAKYGSLDDALRGGRIEIYSGAQPTSADAAVSGTLLCTITAASAAYTPESLATGSVTLTGGASGSVNTVTVNSVDILLGAVPFNGTLSQTATDVAAQISRARSDFTATATGAVVTITAPVGSGATLNTLTVAATSTTITTSTTNMTGGVASVNGLLYDGPTAGALPKLASQVWSGLNAATGTAGWFRQYGGPSDAGGLDSAAVALRIDGAIATSGAELNLNTTAVTTAATTTLASWLTTFPAQ